MKDYNSLSQKSVVDLLPPKTHIGKNTIGCLVENEAYAVTYKIIDGKPTIRGEFDRLYNELFISSFAVKDMENSVSLGLRIVNLKDTGIYFPEFYDVSYTKYNKASTDSPKVYRPDLEFPNQIQVTYLDTSNKIIAGIFDLQLVAPKSNQKLRITSGRFDVRYRYTVK